MPIGYTDRASQDLGAIYDHLSAESSPRTACRVLLEIDAACQRLADLPYRGRLGRRRGTRELTVVWPYVIVYRVRPDTISIERVIHGARRR